MKCSRIPIPAAPAIPESPPDRRLPTVPFVAVECPSCRSTDRLNNYSTNRRGCVRVHYYQCKHCGLVFRSDEPMNHQPAPTVHSAAEAPAARRP